MTGLSSIPDSLTWYALCISALVLFVGSLSVVFRSWHDNRKKSTLIISVLNLILISFLIVIFMDCGHYMRMTTNRDYSLFEYELFDLPFYIYALIELLSCVVFLSLGFEGLMYRSSNLTKDAVQDSIDALPEGVLISSKDGTVRLFNLKMNYLCRALTGKVLTNSVSFWNCVEKAGKEQGGQYLIHTDSDEVWLFYKEKLTINDEDYDQITATDVTERYKIIEDLEKKNEHLQDIRSRMKAVSDLSGDMFVAQEEADARTALHNQLGQVLLMGRHYLTHQDVTDPKIVYAATVQMNQFLLGEAKEPYNGDEDIILQAVSMANSIGVHVEILGVVPENSDVRTLLSQAITECSANTVKHAEGDKVKIGLSDVDSKTVIAITNNGKPPKGAITESGGLLSLRKAVESAGGVMKLEYVPEFKLIITLG